MRYGRYCLTSILLVVTCLAGCGEAEEQGSEDEESAETLFETADASSDECPDGGTVVTIGTDGNTDGTLGEDEVEETITICDGADGEAGDDGADGDDGQNAECFDREDVSFAASLESADPYRIGTGYTLELDTEASADDLDLVAVGEATVDNLTDGDDGLEAELTFGATGVDSLVLVGSDGCTVDVVRIEIGAPVYPPAYEQIEAGWLHTCGLRTDGSVTCWGSAPATIEGTTLTGHTNAPAADDVQSLSAGVFATCAIHEDDSVSCWGNAIDTSGGSEGPIDVEALDGEFSQIDPAGDAVCGTTLGGMARCALAATDETIEFDAGDMLDSPGDAVIAETYRLQDTSFVVVRLDTGDIYQVAVHTGDGPTVSGTEQLLNEGDTTYTDLEVGLGLVCASDGSTGTCLDLETDETFESASGDVATLSATAHHACVLFDDGSVECFGPGVDTGETDLGRSETEMDVPDGTTFATDVAAGGMHSCGLTDQGLVTCWGEVYNIFFPEPGQTFPAVTEPIQ